MVVDDDILYEFVSWFYLDQCLTMG
jgi:hypothetical protein